MSSRESTPEPGDPTSRTTPEDVPTPDEHPVRDDVPPTLTFDEEPTAATGSDEHPEPTRTFDETPDQTGSFDETPEPVAEPAPEPVPYPTAGASPQPVSYPTAGAVPDFPPETVEPANREVRMRTVVFGLVLLVIAGAVLVGQLTDITVDAGAVLLALMIGGGVLLLAGARRA